MQNGLITIKRSRTVKNSETLSEALRNSPSCVKNCKKRSKIGLNCKHYKKQSKMVKNNQKQSKTANFITKPCFSTFRHARESLKERHKHVYQLEEGEV